MHTRTTLDQAVGAENEALLRHMRLGALILVELGPVAIDEADPGYERAQAVSTGRFDGVLIEHGRNLPGGLRLSWKMSLRSDKEGGWRHYHSFSLGTKYNSPQAIISLQRNASQADDVAQDDPWTLELDRFGEQASFTANLDHLIAALPPKPDGLDDHNALMAKLRSLTDFDSIVRLTGVEAAACIMATLAICKAPPPAPADPPA